MTATTIKTGDWVTPRDARHPLHGQLFIVGAVEDVPPVPAMPARFAYPGHPEVPARTRVFATWQTAEPKHPLCMSPEGWAPFRGSAQ
jgi:hypothetical protein